MYGYFKDHMRWHWYGFLAQHLAFGGHQILVEMDDDYLQLFIEMHLVKICMQ